MSALIETSNLKFKYNFGTATEKLAVDNINIKINKGDFIGLIGPTGSGKSTFIKLLNGLLKPTSGQVLFLDQQIKDIKNLYFKIGMVFQYPEAQLFEETVFKDVAFGPSNMGLTALEIEERIKLAAKFVELDENVFSRSPFEISGGEKRRVAIAGVIAMTPDVLILDEPTAGLDPRGREVLLSHIAQYHKHSENTVILVSHNMEDVAKFCNKILVMNKGQAVLFEETRKVFSKKELLLKFGLKLPQITDIMEEVRSKGFNLPNGILSIDEATSAILKLARKRNSLYEKNNR